MRWEAWAESPSEVPDSILEDQRHPCLRGEMSGGALAPPALPLCL